MRFSTLAMALALFACKVDKISLPQVECTHSSDCSIASQICASGRCVAQCAADRDCFGGQTCSAGACVAPPPGCATASDCSSGQTCGPTGHCVASCLTSSNCSSGLTCSNGACVSTDSSTATISGTAVYAGQSNSAGITVALRGGGSAQATTDASGSYSFAGLSPAIYTLTFTAPFSAEGSISLQVSAKAGVVTTAAPVTFTPVGELRGVVHLSGQTSALDVKVFVSGTSRGASADSQGNYDITGVPPGSQQVVASYPGFIAATVTVTVAIGALTQVPDLTLQPQVIVNNAVFAFASQPPLQVVQGHAYAYRAVAGGAGITGVTYSIAAGPSGMSIDPASGVVTYTPSVPGNYMVAIAASSTSGGNVVIYQVFNLQVLSPAQQILPTAGPVHDGDSSGGATWVVQDAALYRFSPQIIAFDATKPLRSAKTTSVSVTNNASITGYTYPGGKVTSLSTPMGTIAATWAGGKIGSFSIANAVTVASTRLEGGTIASVAVPGLDTATSISYTSGTAQSVAVNKPLQPSSIDSLDTGVVSALTSTTLTDNSANFTFAPNTRYLTDVSGGYFFSVTGVTAHTLTISSGDLTTAFSNGHRYFLTNSFYGSLVYTVTLNGTDFSTGYVGRMVDIYLSGAFFGSFAITSGANGSFTFNAPVASYAALFEMPASPSGFILIGETGGYHLVTLTDSTAAFAVPLSPQKLGSPGISTTYVIDSNTATSIVFRVNVGTDVTPVTARLKYVLVGAQGVQATVQLKTGGLTPSDPALASQWLFNDSTGFAYPISGNTANSITIALPPQDLPRTWAAALVVPTAPSTNPNVFKSPAVVITDQQQGLTASAFVGRQFVTRSGDYPNSQGTVTANTATTVTFASYDCYSCPGRVRNTLAAVVAGGKWAVLTNSSQIRVQLNALGMNWPADSLVGRVVLPETNLNVSGTITSNLASSVVVQVGYGFTIADFFTALAAGQHFYLADAPQQPYLPATIPVVITDTTATWAPGAFKAFWLVNAQGRTLGQITANTATIVTVDASLGSLSSLVAGQPFAFGQPDGTPLCPPGQVNATVTLKGATLVPGAYDTLFWSSTGAPVISNDASTAVVAFCSYRFGDLPNAIGSTGALGSNGAVSATLADSSASYTPGALKGFQLGTVTPSSGPFTVVDNAAQSITLTVPSYLLSQLSSLTPGSSYFLADLKGLVQLQVTTSAALTANSLVGRFVHAIASSSYVDLPLPVSANDAGSLTASVNVFEFRRFVAGKYSALQMSVGSVVAIGDSTAAFTSGALVGQQVWFGESLIVTSNTGQSLVAVTSDPSLPVFLPAVGALYTISSPLAGGNRVRALADGTALVGLGGNQAAIAKVGAAGLITLFTPLGTGKQVQVTPRPALRGTYTSITAQSSPSFFQITDPTANWTPNALAGAVVTVRNGFSGWNSFTVVKNTSTALTVFTGGTFLGADTSQAYLIDPMRLDVSGGGLTPHAYAGVPVFLQGVTSLVRDNDAGSLLLYNSFGPFAAAPAQADTGGATAWLQTGLRGRRVNGIALSGSGFVAATDDGLTLFDGTTWSHLGVRETTAQLATGTVDDFDYGSVTCNACNFTPGAYAGAQLLLSDGAHPINGNTAHVLYTYTPASAPLLGDSFAILDGHGLVSGAADVAVDGPPPGFPSRAVSSKVSGAAGPCSPQPIPSRRQGRATVFPLLRSAA